MTHDARQAPGGQSRLKRLVRFGLPLLILAGGIVGAQVMIASRPPVPKVAPQEIPTLVEVFTVQAADEQTVIPAYGSVRAHRELTVFPRVEGYLTAVHDKLISGGLVNAGETLIRIDPQDYELAAETERGRLAKAEFELRVEEGNQVVARREWNLLESSIETSEMGRLLALRQPHLAEKRAAVAAAKSRLAQAELNLERTRVTAPCDALVLDEHVEVGQLVNARSPVANLVCTDMFRVEASIALDQLGWVKFPEQTTRRPQPSASAAEALDTGQTPGRGSTVRILRDLGHAKTTQWTGWIERLLGNVTENGRMARLLVLVPDPLGRERADQGRSQLLLGEYVRVEILGPKLPSAISLPRSSVREGNRVWIYDAENRLEIRHVDVALSREDSVVIRGGIAEGERVITSPLPAALPGMLLQRAGEPGPTPLRTTARLTASPQNSVRPADEE